MKHEDLFTAFLPKFETLTAYLHWSDSAISHALYAALPYRITLEIDQRHSFPSTYGGLVSLVRRLDGRYWRDEKLRREAELPEQAEWAQAGRGFFGTPLGSPGGSATAPLRALCDSGAPMSLPLDPTVGNPMAPSSGMPSLISVPIEHASAPPLSPLISATVALGQAPVPEDRQRARRRSAGPADPAGRSRARDGGLHPYERERRMKQRLCFYCGGGGHRAVECRIRPRYRDGRSVSLPSGVPFRHSGAYGRPSTRPSGSRMFHR